MQTFTAITPTRFRQRAGFTITEMSVVSLLLALILGTIIGLAVFTLRLSSGANRQLEMDSQARVVNLMVAEIKSAQQVSIQNYNGTTFTSVAVGQPQVGNAMSLVIENSDGTTKQVIYYMDSLGQLFRSVVSGGAAKMWIDDITSATPFSGKDYAGAILTTPSQKMLVDIRLTGVDSNTRDFRQTITRQVTVNRRN